MPPMQRIPRSSRFLRSFGVSTATFTIALVSVGEWIMHGLNMLSIIGAAMCLVFLIALHFMWQGFRREDQSGDTIRL